MTIPEIIKKSIKDDDTITQEFRNFIDDILALQNTADEEEKKDGDTANISVQITRALEDKCTIEKFVKECEEYE